MDIQLTACFGYVQVVFKEFIYRCQCFIIEIIHRQSMQNLLDEHPAQRQRQLINQATDAQLFIVHDIFIRLKDFANLQRHLRFLIGTGNILQIAYNRTAGNINTAVCFRIQCFLDGLRNAVDFVRGFLLSQLLHQNNAVLIHRRYKILCFRRENAPYNFHHIHFLINVRFN